jgi:hypothetical protein
VKHFKTGEPLRLSRKIITIVILMTIIDIADQFMDYQDKLYENDNGQMEFSGDNWGDLWPGIVKPDLWMNVASRMENFTCKRSKSGVDVPLIAMKKLSL